MMNPTFATRNLIRTAIPQTPIIKALYYLGATFFDLLISEIDNISVVNTSKNLSLMDSLEYDCVLSNDPVELGDLASAANNLHLKTCLFMHNPLPSMFKKEDRYILSSALKHSSVCCLTDSAYKDSFSNDTKYIPYGIPAININKSIRKKILFVNTKNNTKITQLYQKMQQQDDGVGMIDSLANKDIHTIIDILNEYSVIFALDSYIDVLLSLACGCSCITNLTVNAHGINTINDFRDIEPTLNKALIQYNLEQQGAVSGYIQQTYNMDNFKQSIESFIKQSVAGN